MTQLSVNINKFALLRNSRGTNHPDLKEVAKKSVEMAKIAPEDEYSLIASKELLQQFPIQEDKFIDSYDSIEPSIDIIRDRASEVEDTALSVKGITNSVVRTRTPSLHKHTIYNCIITRPFSSIFIIIPSTRSK